MNNPWARKVMFPEKLIKPLDRAAMEPYFEKMLPMFKPPYKWAMDADGKELLGMCQRFGPYSYVVNTDKISRKTAEDEGWNLFIDDANAGKYGILDSADWNVFNVCVIAGFDPFKPRGDAEITKFTETAKKVFKNAKVVGDIATMNQALVSGEIDFHMTGGTYSASPARADGHQNIRGITPAERSAGRRQGRHLLDRGDLHRQQSGPLAAGRRVPEARAGPHVAHTVAFAEGTFNPVAQMGNPDCFKLFTKDELDAIQWDSLDEEMARSVEYDVVPDYDKLLEIMNSAKREVSGG